MNSTISLEQSVIKGSGRAFRRQRSAEAGAVACKKTEKGKKRTLTNNNKNDNFLSLIFTF
ncbi:MAG: hypothetical protein J6B91_03705 [Prevotella sp.]|nr:hypothetical protein [Prevotella sp.]